VQKDALTYPDGAWSGVQNEFATALERSTGRGWRVGVWRWIWGRGPREGPFPGDYGHVRGVRNGMVWYGTVLYGITTQRSDNNDGENNCNSGKQELARHALDTWSAQGAKDSRYLEGLPSCRAAEIPGRNIPDSGDWHAITSTDVCCCVISINGVLAGIAVTVAVATAVTYSSQMLFVFICQHATSSPSPSQRRSLHVCVCLGCCTQTTRIGSQLPWEMVCENICKLLRVSLKSETYKTSS